MIESDVEMLARMMADGFSSFGTRFDALEGNMEGLEDRMQTLESEVRSTNQHIDRVIMPMLDSHESRIKNLEVRAA